ncbi:hypothetical protein B0H14DRAFT_3554251 [Mycena olivaceomarginata]|nr:hypothetical protein B0H14DRAFT_3554251 [Mycena olivaceomarginata]
MPWFCPNNIVKCRDAFSSLRPRFQPRDSHLTRMEPTRDGSDPENSSQPPAKPPRRQWIRQTDLPLPSIQPPPANAANYRLAADVVEQLLPRLPPPRPELEPFSHQQQRLRQPRRSAEQITSEKFEFVDKLLGSLGPFESLGEFLAFVFFNRVHGETDPRGESHAIAVAKFLRGSTTIRMSHILPLIYKHRNSFPSINSLHSAEQNDMFSDAEPPKDIRHARPFISTWALRLTAAEARKQIWDGTRDDPDDPDDHVQLRAQTNGRGKGKVITREDISRFSIASVHKKYMKRQRVPMFLTKYMSAPRVKGAFVVRATRPYPMT